MSIPLCGVQSSLLGAAAFTASGFHWGFVSADVQADGQHRGRGTALQGGPVALCCCRSPELGVGKRGFLCTSFIPHFYVGNETTSQSLHQGIKNPSLSF